MALAVLTAARTKPPSFLGAVRHMVLDSNVSWSQDEGEMVLKLCTGLVNFAVLSHLANPSILPILANMRVQRLSASLGDLFGHDFASANLAHQLFAYVTHLDVFDHVDNKTQFALTVRTLPSLTHLCVNNHVTWQIIQALLDNCERLEILANLWMFGQAERARQRAENAPFEDVRFVVGFYRNYWDEWEAGARGAPDFWSVADDFVARKRRGEIEGAIFCCISLSTPHANEQIQANCYWLET
jgi:hypothetical protein